MKNFRVAWFLLALLLISSPGGRITAGERIEMPQGVFYYQPAASVFGSEAIWTNPAALARFRIGGFQYLADYYDNKYAKNWGSVVTREGLGLSYRHIHNPDDEAYVDYILALAFPAGKKLFLGGSYQYFKQGEGIFDNRHFWNAGMLFRPGGYFSFGTVFSNLNRGKIGEDRTEIEQRYSFSYHPSSFDMTLSVDMFLATGTKVKNADYVYHAEFSPVKGLYVNGLLDSDRNFQIGIRANLRQYFVGSHYRADRRGNHRGTTVYVGATSHRQPSIMKDKVRRLSVSVSGSPSENPPDPIFGKSRTSLITTLLNIYRAAEDPSIGEMVIKLNRFALGFGQAQELREALSEFKSRGKRITCHISHPNNLAYYVGSVCDKILVPPVSQLNLVGLRAELTFFAGTLDKLGVDVDLMRIGDYKTAAERYTREEATEENREQVNRLLDDLFDQFVGDIAQGRGIPRDSMVSIIDRGPFTSEEAMQLGLVDGLSYVDEMKKSFLPSMPEISLHRYLSDTLINDNWRDDPVLAVVVAEGEVAFDQDGAGPFSESSDVTPGLMKKAFQRARSDRNIKGIVFRIDSPGGLALAGDEIYHTAAKTVEKKPMVVSMSNMAASGGYYIAMPAGDILANPATITGSIGIYGGKVDLSRLYDKIGLGKELYTRGKHAGMLTTMRPFTEDEREKYFSHLQAMYGHFVSLVAGNRNLTTDSVDNLARGRMWTGREALQNGLVDELGGVKRALDLTAEKLALESYKIEFLPRKRPLFLLPGKSLIDNVVGWLGFGSKASEVTASLVEPTVTEGILARMPFDINID